MYRGESGETYRAEGFSISLMAVHCERYYGSSFIHNPDRWKTDDGYTPYKVLVLYFRALRSTHAYDRIVQIQAHQISTAEESERQRLWADLKRQLLGG